MSILSGYKKVKDRILTSSGYQLLSRWTSSNTVDFDDGKTAQTKVGAINGIIKDKNSLSTVTDDSFAAGAVAVKDAIADVNSKLSTETEAIVHDNITGIFTYTRIGYICVGCGTLTVTNDIGAYSAIVSNLPQTYTGNPYPGAFVAEDNTYNDFYINGSAIVNRKPVSKGHTLRLSCVYMCQ